ncbi:hypothetical protein [Cryptosporangium sp. NPDC048952]|uniref:hypothetical protein n=1 Tax=Cryptosporangium sp. NPDC048952 TaxID=3363961 RepID=UPI0037248F1F
MVMMRADGWTVEVYLHSDTPGGWVAQHVQIKDRGYLVYAGPDLAQAQLEAEASGAPWELLKIVDDDGAPAAGW